MKYKFLWAGAFLFLLINLFLLPLPGVKAQSLPANLKSLTVALWPEYDRPEVLVIYRVQLSADTSLPAQVTFRLPGYVEDLHAVAIEQDGRLLNVSPDTIELLPKGDDLWLTFSTSSLNVHFEYYDPVILTKQNQTRQLVFDFSAPYDIETASFEIQQPFAAEEFALIPEPVSTLTHGDNLQYSTIEVANLAADEIFKLSATYRRPTDEVSIQTLPSNIPSQSVVVAETSPSLSSENLNLGYILVGAGLALLLGTGGYWWWKRTHLVTTPPYIPPKNNRRIRHKKKQASKRMGNQSVASRAAVPPSPTPSSFCYQCGVALYTNANFCHACGAKRRTD